MGGGGKKKEMVLEAEQNEVLYPSVKRSFALSIGSSPMTVTPGFQEKNEPQTEKWNRTNVEERTT
jgi:hypothetical protein